jgi:hypothetical protein
MDVRSKFTIDRLSSLPDRWYVDWSKLGEVEQDIAKDKLCEIVFDQVRPKGEIGIGYNVQYFRPKDPEMIWPPKKPFDPNGPIPEKTFELEEFIKWEVRWISVNAWMSLREHDYDSFAYHLFRSGTPHSIATGIILETLDQCELFVDLMEAQFTFYRLKQDYA